MINWQLSNQGIHWPVSLDRIAVSGVDAKIQPPITVREDSCLWLCSPWSRFTSNFYALIGQNMTGEFTRKIYATSWILFTLTAEADRVLCQPCDVFNCLFPLDVQNKIQLLSGVFCYSWLVCLLGFWLRNTPLVKVGNPISDGIVFVFHLASCVRGLKSLKPYWPYLIPFRSCISNGKPE